MALVFGAEGSTTSLCDVFDVLCDLGADARPDIDPRRALGCPGPPSDVPRGRRRVDGFLRPGRLEDEGSRAGILGLWDILYDNQKGSQWQW